MCVIWNSLPIDLRSGNHLNAFKKNLKTYYFRSAFEVYTNYSLSLSIFNVIYFYPFCHI